jgi:hypothetical protein
MVLYYDNRFAQIRFGAERLMRALKGAGIFAVQRFLFEYTPPAAGERVITVSFAAQKFPVRAEGLAAEGFEIRAGAAGVTHILGADITGAMYGLLELAEDIGLRGLEGVLPKTREPFLKKRGIKFNLPFEPYDMGDALSKNVATCLDRDYWAKYIDFLAEKPLQCAEFVERAPLPHDVPAGEISRYLPLLRDGACTLSGFVPLHLPALPGAGNSPLPDHVEHPHTTFVAKGLGCPNLWVIWKSSTI